MKISLPYIDQPLSFWQEIKSQYGDSIQEVYFPISDHLAPSGRPVQPLKHIYSFLEKSDLPKAVLINPIILSRPIEQCEDLILNELRLLSQYYGVHKVTVADLRLGQSIKRNIPIFEITASTLMRIQNPEQLTFLQNHIDGLVPDTAITRDLSKLQALRANFKGIFKLIVNEGCLSGGCPLRTQHFYEMSCGLANPASLCQDLLIQYPWLRLKSAWILPQFLHFYDGFFDVIKLAGRVTLQNPEKYQKVLNAYHLRAEISVNEIGSGPAGMIENLPITAEFFYHTITCDKNCCNCTYCKDYYEKYHR